MTKLTDEEKKARALRRYAREEVRNIKSSIERFAFFIEMILERYDNPEDNWLMPPYLAEHIPALRKLYEEMAPVNKYGDRETTMETEPTDYQIDHMLHLIQQRREARKLAA